ncbi:MAG: energy transducer TonB [Bacteroidales bacterium]|nr:energy transducer TonB [Bacteroidales bacterium]
MSPENKHIKQLWTPDGCISQEGLKAYIDGYLSKDEIQIFEDHAKNCELCSDAIDGAKLMGSGDEFLSNVSSLQEKITSRVSKSRSKKILPVLSLAATIILLLGIFFIYQKRNETTLVAVNSDKQKEEIITEEIAKKENQQEFRTETIDNITSNKSIILETTEEEKIQPPAIMKVQEKEKPVEAELEEFEIIDMVADEDIVTLPLEAIGNNEMIEEIIIQKDDVAEAPPANNLALTDVDKGASKKAYGGVEGAIYELKDEEVSDVDRSAKAKSSGFRSRKDANNYVEEAPPSGNAKMEVVEDEKSIDLLMETDKEASFQGGNMQKFKDWIYSQLNYNLPVDENASSKHLVIKFLIDTSGNVKNIAIVNSLNKEFDKKVTEIIKSSPKWEPAVKNGKVTNCEMTAAVFEIQ